MVWPPPGLGCLVEGVFFFGVDYLTSEKTGEDAKTLTFASFEDALLAIEANRDLDIQAKVVVRVSSKDANVADSDRAIFRVMTGRGQYEDLDVTEGTKRFETTVGRIIFNRIFASTTSSVCLSAMGAMAG